MGIGEWGKGGYYSIPRSAQERQDVDVGSELIFPVIFIDSEP